ncbi:MAG: GGDEF domain-containing protein [Gammaproteobacteria bacterium]|nr:GGDEF domain-containing protein [Gammaproteobacteria bacterium]
MDIAERSLWSHQSDDKKGFISNSGGSTVEIGSDSKLSNLLSRLYFVVPFLILGSLPVVEFIVNGAMDLTLPNILIVLASIMCLVTWTMKINSEFTNLMPAVITAIASTALAMLMVSKTPDLHMHATASMMVMMVWLTSAPRVNVYVQSITTLLIIIGLSYILITANLSTQNLVTVFVLLISGIMMGGFTQVHRHLHEKDNVPDDLLNGDLSDIVYDEAEEEIFEETHEADLEQDWPVVLEKLSKSLNSIHDVDVLFNKMLVTLHESIPYKAAVVGMLQGRDLTTIQTYGDDSFMTPDVLNWSNDFIRSLADKQQEFTNSFINNGETYYRLDLPILSNGKFVGVVTLVRESEAFDNYSCKLSSSILFHSMVSLRNARLYEEFKKLKSKGKQTTLITRDQFMDSSAKRISMLNEPRSASLMIVEIDHFDKLEERYNKETSLAVYNAITSILLSATRDNDILGRYGNEGYIILLNDMDLLEAKKQAERLRELISKTPCKTSVGKITTTVSIGLSSASHSDEDIASLSQRAGMALYVAKESGKNSVKVKL